MWGASFTSALLLHLLRRLLRHTSVKTTSHSLTSHLSHSHVLTTHTLHLTSVNNSPHLSHSHLTSLLHTSHSQRGSEPHSVCSAQEPPDPACPCTVTDSILTHDQSHRSHQNLASAPHLKALAPPRCFVPVSEFPALQPVIVRTPGPSAMPRLSHAGWPNASC